MGSDAELAEIAASFAELAEAARRDGGTLRVKASELRIVAARVADLVSDHVKLRAENARLQQQNDQLHDAAAMFEIVRTENARLRASSGNLYRNTIEALIKFANMGPERYVSEKFLVLIAGPDGPERLRDALGGKGT